MRLLEHMASKISGGAVAFERTSFTEQCGFLGPLSKTLHCTGSNLISPKLGLKESNTYLSSARLCSSSEGFWCISAKPYSYMLSRRQTFSCRSRSTRSSEAECVRNSEDCRNVSSGPHEKEHAGRSSSKLCEQQVRRKNTSTYSIVYNDAKYVNERARNDIVLLSRYNSLPLCYRQQTCLCIDESFIQIIRFSFGITRLNDRARQDVAFLGLEFLKLDARAREDTEKIDHGMKRKAAHLHHIATILTDKAQSKLKTVADQHWSDGALEADLRRADLVVRRRAMEDAFMALKFVRNVHVMMARKLYQQQPRDEGSLSVNDMMGFITLEKNGKAHDLFAREVSTDRITAIQEAYWSMASALSEADGIDYTDPEELELLVAALIDLDAMDGKSSVSLLAECSSSPDVNTRQALANALAAAPSMWTLGNAGMGALQRLAEDSNPAVAAAASKAIGELKQQWELEEGDSLRFMMNQYSREEDEDNADPEDGDDF